MGQHDARAFSGLARDAASVRCTAHTANAPGRWAATIAIFRWVLQGDWYRQWRPGTHNDAQVLPGECAGAADVHTPGLESETLQSGGRETLPQGLAGRRKDSSKSEV